MPDQNQTSKPEEQQGPNFPKPTLVEEKPPLEQEKLSMEEDKSSITSPDSSSAPIDSSTELPTTPSTEIPKESQTEVVEEPQSESPPSPSEKESFFPETPEVSPPPSTFETSPKGESKLASIKKILPFILILAIGLIGFFVFFKFFKGKSLKPKEITLTYWGLWEPEESFKGVIAEWEKSHPKIKINYTRQSQKEYRERLQSALARGQGPDIFRFHISWIPMFKNELEPVPGTVINASQFESAYYPVITENLRSGTNFLGIPLMIDTLALYYNEDIFRAAGKSPPSTWEELRQLAVDLTVRDESGQIQTAGVALGTTNNVDHWSDILGLMILQNGGNLTKPAACAKQGQEEICLGPDALTFYTIFAKNDKVWSNSLPSSTLAFATGKVAMYFGPSWRVFDIKAINPNLNFKIISVPQLPETNIAWATFWVEGVAKRSQYQAEAWEFLKFLSSSQTLEKLYQAESSLRLFGEIYPRVDMADKLKQNPLVSPFINQTPHAQNWYLCSNTFDNGINDRMIKYFEDAVNAVNGGKAAREALQTASDGVAQLLSQYGLGSYTVR